MARNNVSQTRKKLNNWKYEIAKELNVPFSDYNGHLTSRQCGSVGGEMVKRMVGDYESKLK